MSDRIMFIMEKFPEDTYTREPDSNIYKIMNAIATELDIFVEKLENVRNSSFLDDANGTNLDKIAAILGMFRFFGEADDDFRARITARVPTFVGGGTIESIENIILEYLKAEAIVIEHHKPNNGFASFHNGVVFGMNASVKSDEEYVLNISGGTAYINGKRFFKEPEEIIINVDNSTYYIFMNSEGEYIARTSPNRANDEILLYKTIFNSANGSLTVEDLKFNLNPDIHNITNTATISIQIPYDIDESILAVEEIKNIIISTKAAGIAVLMRIVDTFREPLYIGKDIPSEYFLVGRSFLGSSNKIGYNKSLISLAKIDGTLKPYGNFTFREVGAAKIGHQDYGGF